MPFNLPPLTSLRFFEAAGRHLSFKRAAEELNVTPSAVSHGIVTLERALGLTLFVRGPGKLSLTLDGADYLPYISEALSLIAIGTQRLPGQLNGRFISVSCAPTFAARWLLPRLADFKQRWPHLSIAVDTSHRKVGFPVDGFDFAIRLNRIPLADAAWTRLFCERLVPVCSPDYAKKIKGPDGRYRLAEATLIHVVSVSEEWSAWIDATGTEGLDLTSGIRLDTIHLAFDAAKAGLGIAMGRKPLVDEDLAKGLLVEVGAEAAARETAYWLVCSDAVDHQRDLRNFKRWLLEQAGVHAAA